MYTTQTLQEKIKSLGTWYHEIDLGNGVKTGSDNPYALNPAIRWGRFESFLPKDMTGKTVLDVGCNSGYFSIQSKLRGAEKVTAVDAIENSVKQAGFLSEYFRAPLETVHQDVHHYALTHAKEERDIIIYSRLFYHLRYPTLVFDLLACMVKEVMVFITDLSPNPTSYEPKENYTHKERDTEFKKPNYPHLNYVEKKYSGDWSNWWVPNESYVLSMIRSAGLKVVARPTPEIFILAPHRKPQAIEVVPGVYFPPTSEEEKRRIFT